MAPEPIRKIFAKVRNMDDHRILEMRGRAARWLHGYYGRNASKRLQEDFDISQRSAEYALGGQISSTMFERVMAAFGRPLSDFLFQPVGQLADGDPFSSLDSLDHDFRSAAAASTAFIRDGLGLAPSRQGMAHGAGRVEDGAEGHCRYEAGEGSAPTKLGQSARELMALCGQLQQHQDIPMAAADARHVQLLEVWRTCGGEVTAGFIALLDSLGLADITSVYTPEIKIQRIGTGTLFWSDEQRRAVQGKSVFEVPAPISFKQAVFERLSASVASGQPSNTLLRFNTGLIDATWKRVCYPFPKSECIFGVPALQVAA